MVDSAVDLQFYVEYCHLFKSLRGLVRFEAFSQAR